MSEAAPIPKQDPARIVLFDVELFNKLIDGDGRDLYWDRAMYCPCREDVSRQALPTCDLCKGTGFMYFGRQKIRGVLTALTSSKAFSEGHIMGDWVIGKAALTVKFCDFIGHRDKITHVNSVMSYMEVFEYKTGVTAYDLRYDVIEVIRLQSKKSGPLTFGTDYTVVDGQLNITKTLIHKEPVSILYMYHPVWVVIDFLHAVRDVSQQDDDATTFTRREAPRHAMLALDFLVENQTVQEDV